MSLVLQFGYMTVEALQMIIQHLLLFVKMAKKVVGLGLKKIQKLVIWKKN